METLSVYSDNSALAQAAYSNLENGVIGSVGIESLQEKGGMALAQAEKFASEWVVVDSINQSNGFSATIFESTTGERHLAIRGTELTDPMDLWTDFKDIMDNGTYKLQEQFNSLEFSFQLITATEN